ncbi:pilin [Vibrio scophthalmi]|uniref:Type IV pilin PilA n=1 Tax=Vibrio scophthalmi LMG 19158 TaxID=870967 RepID=F9RL47_9VIBR|nr:prepilin-type N-terminal cleavage/methylation domain-containing protein [Vibrio scophthalmi]EGU39232.1 type IV pilin PilA [Vibrio scophthalmi LMG 19158]
MNNTSTRSQRGFTLIELMVVMAIVAILAVFAVPAYQDYTKKATMAEFPTIAAPVKLAVEMCALEKASSTSTFAANCSTSAGHVPSAAINNISVTATNVSGAIQVIAQATSDKGPVKSGEEFILSATYSDQGITWAASCTDAGGNAQSAYCPD